MPHRGAAGTPESTSEWCQMMPDDATTTEDTAPRPVDSPPPAPVKLTPRQMLAVPYIVSAPSMRQSARAAHIGRATLTRWMHDPDFRAEIEQARRRVADLAFAEMNGLALKSVVALADLLEHPDPHVRNAAIRTALQNSLKLRELNDVRNRMDIMDYAFSMLKSQGGAR